MPNRIIKESICRSDSIDSLSWFEEVLFYRLIVSCDDYGRFDGRPAVIKGACFPLKDDITKKHISEAIDKLSTVGLVRGYEVQGRSYLQLTTWNCHQQIRAKKSKYPSPDESCDKNQSNDKNGSHYNASDKNGNQLISSDFKCPRESKYENRESYSINENAHDDVNISRFEEFWTVYPVKKNRYLAEQAYMNMVLDGTCSENELIEAAKNYAEYCKIIGISKIYYAENFVNKCIFEDYLPGKYKRPLPKSDSGSKNRFHNFDQREYDYGELEKQLLSGCKGGC